jgi:hypothetical protein
MTLFNTYNWVFRLLFVTIGFFFCVITTFCQPPLPERTMTVTPTQAIHFGAICVGNSGGTVVVGWDGSRSSPDGVTILSMAPPAQPAIFEIKLCPGRNVRVSMAASVTLYGSNGGELTLDIGPTEKGAIGSFFITGVDCNFITPLRVGGTLHIPASPRPGTYSGTFDITFEQE